MVVTPEGVEDPRLAMPGAETLAPGVILALVEGGARPDVIVVSPDVDEPVAFAQRLHRVDRTLALVLVAEADGLAPLAQAVRLSPFLGPDVTCRSTAEAELLAVEVAELAERAAQRRRFRATLSSASAQLTAATLQRSPHATRFAAKVLDDAPLAVVAVARDGSIAGWNRRASALFGRAERDALGSSFEALFPASSRAALRALLAAPAGAEGEPATAVLEYQGGDGRRFLDVTASAVPAPPDGQVLLVMVRDETDRVVAEREREAARAELAFLVDAGAALAASTRFEETLRVVAHLAVPTFASWCVVDLVDDGRIRRVAIAASNPQLEALVRELQERYPPTWDSPQPAPEALRRGEPILFRIDAERIRALTIDDEHFDLMLRIGPRSAIALPLAARGETLGALTFVRNGDVPPYTERDVDLARRVADRASIALDNVRLLKAAQERARAARVLDTVGDGVFLVDRGDRVQLWNAAAERVTGIAAAEIVGRPLSAHVPGWEAIAPAVPVTATGEPSRTATLPLGLRDAEIWVAIAGVAAEEGTVYAFRDVSDEVAVERMKSDFLATVSHEIRTPLASVYGAALTLDRPETAGDAELRQRLRRIIVQEASRLAHIVDDLLLASQLESGAIAVDRVGVDAREILRDAVDAARVNLPDARRLRLHANEPASVVGDGHRMRQVVSNLIENALKYSPPDAPVDVELERGGTVVRLWVHDRGTGIPPEERERIFDKFHRLDPDQTSGVGGTGLGLYIARALVRRMGGRIGVEPRDGGGSSFFVEVPRAS